MHLTPNARDEVLRWSQRLENEVPRLRITVHEGGCGGLMYDLQFQSVLQTNDTEFLCEDVNVHIDAQSLPYLEGLVLDYAQDLMGGSFRFTNPSVDGSCSCGISFARLVS
ncbi:MAG: iron-sulfur cluster assembly accessory protein [Cyanobacteria bacterium P01_H01_bin.121]